MVLTGDGTVTETIKGEEYWMVEVLRIINMVESRAVVSNPT
mgnify:CR=1 FL=1